MKRKLLIQLVLVVFLAGFFQATAIGNTHSDKRPYWDDSPWNLPIGPNPVYEPHSKVYTDNMSGVFGCNPHMYSHPVYEVSSATPMVSVTVRGWFSRVVDDGTRLVRERRVTVDIPIPDTAQPTKGTDSQILIWNPETGEEWGFWQAKPQSDGTWKAKNGYAYNTNWHGVPPAGFISRGSGGPYMAGLIRPWEIRQGKIEHAIGLSYNYPSQFWVYPATKSDGKAMPPALPEGARLQLDPDLTEADFSAWGLDKTGMIIAKALQQYGMILTDGSGHPKLSVEYEATANWGDMLHRHSVKNIPYAAFKVLHFDAPERPDPPTNLTLERTGDGVSLTWDPSPWATHYRVLKIKKGKSLVLDKWVADTRYFAMEAPDDGPCEYHVNAVNHNGVSTSTVAALP